MFPSLICTLAHVGGSVTLQGGCRPPRAVRGPAAPCWARGVGTPEGQPDRWGGVPPGAGAGSGRTGCRLPGGAHRAGTGWARPRRPPCCPARGHGVAGSPSCVPRAARNCLPTAQGASEPSDGPLQGEGPAGQDRIWAEAGSLGGEQTPGPGAPRGVSWGSESRDVEGTQGNPTAARGREEAARELGRGRAAVRGPGSWRTFSLQLEGEGVEQGDRRLPESWTSTLPVQPASCCPARRLLRSCPQRARPPGPSLHLETALITQASGSASLQEAPAPAAAAGAPVRWAGDGLLRSRLRGGCWWAVS